MIRPTETMSEALDAYFADNAFDASTYTERWARFRVGPVPVVIPNTRQRKQALRCHDMHHIVTGYGTDMTGEGEVGAWELATGCGTNVTAWSLNLAVMAQGLVHAPRRLFRAFVRGRRSTNLYAGSAAGVDMSRTVADVRKTLGLAEEGSAEPASPTAADVVLFLWASVAAVMVGFVALLSFPLVSLVGWLDELAGPATAQPS